MWEMQVLSSQRNNNKGDEGMPVANTANENTSGEDRLSGDGVEPGPQSPHDVEHPALRGVTVDVPSEAIMGPSSNGNGAGELSPSNDMNGASGINPANIAAAAVASVVGGGRKRPLLAGGPRTSMTPTKRTVMGLLARARAAQAKQLPTAFPRTTPERTPTLVPLLREDYITGAVNLNLI